MTLLSSILLYLVAPLMAVLAYLHYSVVLEEAERLRTKCNADYEPARLTGALHQGRGGGMECISGSEGRRL